ncbi:HEPN domain-containing protein [Candidatus Woesearchaeota archaeon]|nr:HEPN domain-containing protein [Candidatus Woesearchaeota archaeon]
MKEDKDQKIHVLWCFKQKRGIKLEEQNNTLCDVYIKKSKSSLNMLESAAEKDEIDWISTTAYYARYFAFYALLQKCGIKSEIHDCTISLMHFLFVDEELIEGHFYNELQLAKELRVDAQYYPTQEIDLDKLKKDSETAKSFVLNMEEVIEKITEEQINMIRDKLNNTRHLKE